MSRGHNHDAVRAAMAALACIVLDDPVHYEHICYNHKAPLTEDGFCPLANAAATAVLEAAP